MPALHRRLVPLLVLLAFGPAAGAHAAGFDARQPVFGGRHQVSFDRYSLMIDGQRLTVMSGEFHPFRLPSPGLWRDVLEKLKASGFNAVSIYVDWAYHSPAPGVYDFTGIRDLDRVLRLAEQVGLYVIIRPGPYINAEVDGGGFPGWLTRQLGAARTSAPDYTAAWMDYLTRVDRIVARHQITHGGSVIAYQIENELFVTPDKAPYMKAIVDKVHADGIDVPTTHNMVAGGTWEPIVDLAGPDEYPQGFTCNTPEAWSGGLHSEIDTLSLSTRTAGPATPEFVPELQAGSYDPPGGAGYADCYRLTDSRFTRVLNDSVTAQGVTMRNLYMFYGGTSWGWLPTLGSLASVYSSYDYGAPIDEARELTPKFYELKRLAYAQAALRPLAQTDSAGTPSGSNSDLLYALRRNPVTGTQFVFLRHADPTSTASASTTLSLSTPDGSYPRVPQQPGTAIQIHGRDMLMLVADAALGASHLVYSTSQLMTSLTTGGRDVAVFYGASGDPGETVLRLPRRPRVWVLEGRATASWDAARHDLRLDYLHSGLTRVLVQGAGRPLLLVLASTPQADRLWVTPTAAGPVLSYGPYLVRSAAWHRRMLELRGDTSASFPREGQAGGATDTSAWSAPVSRIGARTRLRLLAAPAVRAVRWNGARLRLRRQSGGALAGWLSGPPRVLLPALRTWRFSAEAPEAQPGFDDSRWASADELSTNNLPNPPESLPVLYMDDYGFHYGNVWYRGHFTATGSESGVSLDCASGPAPGACLIWLNGRFLGETSASGMASYAFPAGSLRAGRDNVVSVLVQSDGHPEDLFSSLETQKAPRGLRGARLDGSLAGLTWRIQGQLGGEHLADPVRGPLSYGGLFGERAGWQRPGFDDRRWARVALPDSWSARHLGPGVGWYRTSFRLRLPRRVDVPIGLRITDTRPYVALIFINGWMMGEYEGGLGPQQLFYLPQGILRPDGRNVLALAVIPRGGGGLGRVALQAYGRYRSGYALPG